jgi:hypothetical protein
MFGNWGFMFFTNVWELGIHVFHKCLGVGDLYFSQMFRNWGFMFFTNVWELGIHVFHNCLGIGDLCFS